MGKKENLERYRTLINKGINKSLSEHEKKELKSLSNLLSVEFGLEEGNNESTTNV